MAAAALVMPAARQLGPATGLLTAAAQIGPGPFSSFPTQNATDGRFLAYTAQRRGKDVLYILDVLCL